MRKAIEHGGKQSFRTCPKMSKCPTCGESFESEGGMKSHHAQTHGESIAGVDIICDYCGEKAHKRQKKKRNDHEFCSRECYNNYQSEELSGENSPHWEGRQITVKCDWCNTETKKHAINYENNENAFCSIECHGQWVSENNCGENNHMFKPENTVECEVCGKEHQKSVSKRSRNDNHFCSMGCRGEWISQNRRGENHPRWIENNNSISYGGTWKQKRKERLEKDGHECVVCGKSNAQEELDSGRGLSVHHIIKAREYLQDDGTLNEERAHRIENLITLCASCHRRWEGIPLRPEAMDR